MYTDTEERQRLQVDKSPSSILGVFITLGLFLILPVLYISYLQYEDNSANLENLEETEFTGEVVVLNNPETSNSNFDLNTAASNIEINENTSASDVVSALSALDTRTDVAAGIDVNNVQNESGRVAGETFTVASSDQIVSPTDESFLDKIGIETRAEKLLVIGISLSIICGTILLFLIYDHRKYKKMHDDEDYDYY
ncbi:MAG: hypothetical protein Q9M91_00865 [Candidatus Dojkabacteria bacterium]|nr:hypothetical protein [Candidatus Dojkabacteria bacterium]MDQ7020378.1 hypothetical protein [Candidatus Dojkabacteria bacterium]